VGRLIQRVASVALDVDAEGVLAAAVLPTALPVSSALGATAGVRNRIEVDATPVGHLGFDGPGAGGPATSSVVLGDLIAIARGGGSTWASRPVAVAAIDRVSRPRGNLLTTAS